MAVFDELQDTEARRSVLPSLNLPMAANCCVAPGDIMNVAGVIDIEMRFGGVRVEGSYNSAVDRTFRLKPTSPPAISTDPLFSRVAVCSARELFMLPVDANDMVSASYSSAPAMSVKPPVTRTKPLVSKVAV